MYLQFFFIALVQFLFASKVTSADHERKILNMEKETISTGPQLIHGRFNHACHKMVVNGNSYIVVIGGSTSEFLSTSNFGNVLCSG